MKRAEKKVNSQFFLRFLKLNYPEYFDGATSITVKKYDEGYMNNVFRLSVNESTQSFVGIMYSSGRYNDSLSVRRLEQVYELSEYVNAAKIPSFSTQKGLEFITTRVALPNKYGEKFVKYQEPEWEVGNVFCLHNYLDGETLPWNGYTRRHLYALGYFMKRFHEVTKKYDGDMQYLFTWSEYLDADYRRLRKYFIKNSEVIEQKLGIALDLAKLEKVVANISGMSYPEQPVHYDLVRGNLLFSHEKKDKLYPIVGVLDFEKVMVAPKVVDIARTLAFLLVDCTEFKEDGEIIKYFLEEGYGIGLSEDELNVIDDFLVYFWMRDLWKFLSSNPYEALGENFHYLESIRRLELTKVISPTT